MKKTYIIFSGLVILGICMIISSVILSKSMTSLANQNHFIDGSLGISQSVSSYNSKAESDYLAIGEVSRMLGYDDTVTFERDVVENKLDDLPYININGELIFSRTAFEEWFVDSARQKKSITFD